MTWQVQYTSPHKLWQWPVSSGRHPASKVHVHTHDLCPHIISCLVYVETDQSWLLWVTQRQACPQLPWCEEKDGERNAPAGEGHEPHPVRVQKELILKFWWELSPLQCPHISWQRIVHTCIPQRSPRWSGMKEVFDHTKETTVLVDDILKKLQKLLSCPFARLSCEVASRSCLKDLTRNIMEVTATFPGFHRWALWHMYIILHPIEWRLLHTTRLIHTLRSFRRRLVPEILKMPSTWRCLSRKLIMWTKTLQNIEQTSKVVRIAGFSSILRLFLPHAQVIPYLVQSWAAFASLQLLCSLVLLWQDNMISDEDGAYFLYSFLHHILSVPSLTSIYCIFVLSINTAFHDHTAFS